MKLFIILLIISSASVVNSAEFHDFTGHGESQILACLDANRQAEAWCEDVEDRGVTEDKNWSCVKSCQKRGHNYSCQSRWMCDPNKSPKRGNRLMETTGIARLPLSMDPCRAAKRKVSRELKKDCGALEGFGSLEDKQYGACDCKPLTVRATGERAAECEVALSAICER